MQVAGKVVSAVEDTAAADGFVLDDGQRELLGRLGVLAEGVAGGALRRQPAARSLYVYGDAGRGKSWLADAFYEALPIRQKTRVHFHGFFDELHRNIHNHRDDRDAVERAIDDVTRAARLLFFDELHVHDSGDARLLPTPPPPTSHATHSRSPPTQRPTTRSPACAEHGCSWRP